MPERIFCVDFGAAYTKVALRPAVQDPAGLVQLGLAGSDFWAPTVVAADWTAGKTKPDLEFGEKAAGIKPAPKVAVYTNFKRDLFAPPAADAAAAHPLDALLQSADFEALAAKYSVLPDWVHALRVMVHSARSLFGSSALHGHAEARKQDAAKAVAHHYFRWLHGEVMKACERLPHVALSYHDIPVRIAVPVFGPDLDNHPGCVRLREALTGTGWKPDARLFVSEPESNAVGVLTKAVNALKKKQINLGAMFDRGPLVTVLKGDKHHPTYRALVIDVGAFTTDFAALAVDTDGKPADSSAGAGFTPVVRSVAFGVSDLDASVRDALPEDKRAVLDGLGRLDFSRFQESVYSSDAGYRVAAMKGAIGGAADRPAVEKCLDAFATRLTAETAAFLQDLGPASMQELILTGGGGNIPAVRDALISAAAQTPGNAFVKTHAFGLKKAKGGLPVDPLTAYYARGGSALGGASIYFEKAYY